ncbi:hypothetical protein [Modicisalibacter luteus]|uniref:hypothetical protein n=1 Tax=Modicisalibacter luteus TaxID=453962 RepID=UPI00364334DC
MAGKVFRSHFQISRLQARQIIDTAFSKARNAGMEPLTAVVLDMGAMSSPPNVRTVARRCAFPWPEGKPMPPSVMAWPAVLWANAMSNVLLS